MVSVEAVVSQKTSYSGADPQNAFDDKFFAQPDGKIKGLLSLISKIAC